MKTALKAKWIAALRSGKYRQYRAGGLQNTNDDGITSFCCLGVLCDISPAVDGHNQSTLLLTEEALRYAGFSDEEQDKLIDMNDNTTTFKGIATYIEKHL